MAHCALDVVRGARWKYVQFAAEGEVMPPLLFDLDDDPDQLHDRVREGDAAAAGREEAQRLLGWRMRFAERDLGGQLPTGNGLVTSRDEWR